MVYTSRGSLGVYYWNPYYTLVYTLLSIGTQVSEFSILGVYTNDSYTGTTYISISGLHLIHVSYGILIVGPSSGTGYSMDTTPIDTIPMDTYLLMEYSYWHLVELVYTLLYTSLYYYSLV
jgi:heme/copper-type cytochrome/quinol oxidase subunit 3